MCLFFREFVGIKPAALSEQQFKGHFFHCVLQDLVRVRRRLCLLYTCTMLGCIPSKRRTRELTDLQLVASFLLWQQRHQQTHECLKPARSHHDFVLRATPVSDDTCSKLSHSRRLESRAFVIFCSSYPPTGLEFCFVCKNLLVLGLAEKLIFGGLATNGSLCSSVTAEAALTGSKSSTNNAILVCLFIINKGVARN